MPDFSALDTKHIIADAPKKCKLKQSYSFTSHIALYDSCPRRYKYFKELGFIQVRFSPVMLGNIIHATLEDIHKAVCAGRYESINDENINLWIDKNYRSFQQRKEISFSPSQRDKIYKQVMNYVKRAESNWQAVKFSEEEIKYVKSDYILKGRIDLIRSEGNSLEIYDFKSEKKPSDLNDAHLEKYRRQLDVYAYLVEQKWGQNVSTENLYYTAEEQEDAILSFEVKREAVQQTIADFDETVHRIQAKDFDHKARDKASCQFCDMRFFCEKEGANTNA